MTTDLVSAPASTPFFLVRVAVRRVVRLSPSYVRVVLGGDDVANVSDNRYDQRIKFLLPGPGLDGFEQRGEDWYGRWRAMPTELRPVIRTYTVREVRREARELDVDIALHGEVGPGSAWATHAREGDEIVLVVPHAGWSGVHGGIDWTAPEGVEHVLLAGDETAAPAIAGILEMLPATTRGLVVIEVPVDDDAAVLGARPPGVEVVVLARGERPVGELLVEVVRERAGDVVQAATGGGVEPDDVDIENGLLWEVPTAQEQAAGELAAGSFAAWLAGEAGAIKMLRRHLVADLGVDRRLVSFMGYWRLGRAESNA